MHIPIPYGRFTLDLDLPEKAVNAILLSKAESLGIAGSEDSIIGSALENPIGSPSLQALAAGKKSAVMIISDHTRPVPSRLILPPMLTLLREGNPSIEITLLVATGFHRATTKAELEEKLGLQIARSEKILVHDCRDAASLRQLGRLPSGASLVVNRAALDTDLLLAEGFIEPHFFAGFSGGRKSVLPGICGKATVLGNHCGAFIAHPLARAGCLDGNPIHEDMAAAARMTSLAFILNVVINDRKQVIAAFAGNPEAAHRQGCGFLSGLCRAKAAPADIVIASNGGEPLDQNIYQAVKGMCAAQAAASDRAVIILCAECRDGTGGKSFYSLLRDCTSAAGLYEKLSRVPMDRTRPDQWEAQILARILSRHTVIMVTRPELAPIVADMKMAYSATLAEAVNKALRIRGEHARFTVIPNGLSVIVN